MVGDLLLTLITTHGATVTEEGAPDGETRERKTNFPSEELNSYLATNTGERERRSNTGLVCVGGSRGVGWREWRASCVSKKREAGGAQPEGRNGRLVVVSVLSRSGGSTSKSREEGGKGSEGRGRERIANVSTVCRQVFLPCHSTLEYLILGHLLLYQPVPGPI